MFKAEGAGRSLKKNMTLAGYLAFVAGFVNSGGFILIGSFTSHVTGSVGRVSSDVAAGNPGAAISAVLLVMTFFAGAFAATLIVEGKTSEQRPRAYGVALLAEAGLLTVFVFVAGLSLATHPRLLDAEASILCFALGMQNSLVTRLSGAVVRTTHLTGVMTDLAIEAARWYRWHRTRLGLPELLGSTVPPPRPEADRSILLATIIGTFVAGAVIGAVLTFRSSRWAMIFPAGAVFAASGVAFYQWNSVSIPSPAPSAPDVRPDR